MFKQSLLFFAVCGLSSLTLAVQAQESKTITVHLENTTVLYALQTINRLSGNAVTFQEEVVAKEKRRVTIHQNDVPVLQAVRIVLEGTSLECKPVAGDRVLVAAKEEVQSQVVQVKGRVVDDDGNPVPGATVIIYGTTQGVATDSKGEYVLMAQPDAVLQFSFIGYKTETVALEGRTKVDVALKSESKDLDEAVVVAFGTQKKESVVSSITTISPMDLKSSSSDLTTQLAGKIAGIVGWQTGGLPGALTEEEMNTEFYVRGITSFQSGANRDPLILIDGVEMSKLDLARLAPEDIDSFSVMKDASATAMYGARGANGVILVTTKKGQEGSVYTSVRYEAVASMPTKQIDVVDPVTYMRLYNEALMTRDPLATPQYTAQDIQRRIDKNFPSWVYPANDWYDILFKDYNVNHRLGINIRGGSNVMQYYASVNYNRDMGMLKTDKLNEFDVNIKNSTLSFRVNLNVNLHPQIKLLYNSTTNWDKYHGPLNSVAEAYKLAFQADPVAFAPTYPADLTYNWEHIRFGARYQGGENPYATIHQGYLERNRYSTTNQLEYIHNLSSLVKGLEVRARVALSQAGYYSIPYSTKPFFYRLQSFNESTGEHTLFAIDPQDSDRTIEMLEDNKQHTSETQLTYEVRAYHTAAWKDHQTSLTAVFNAQESTSSEPSSFLESVEHRNLGFSMRGTYGYKDRYFLEGSFGYNGSERFAKKNKMGFFPALGAAYVISGEPWMQGPANSWLPFLKLRASWGKVGNDGIIERPRFVHLQEVVESSVNSMIPGLSTTDGWAVNNYPNEDIQWEINEQVNFGIEAKLFKGIFEFTLDAYQQVRHNILSQRMTIPAQVGLANYQLDNIGKARGRGLDFSGKIQHAFTPDFWIILNGTFTYSKAIIQELDEADDTPEWQSRIGHEISQQVGFIDQGLFRDQAEVDNAPTQNGNYGPGDIRYRDVDGDGTIGLTDAVHIGFPETPRIIYGFSGFLNYKNWEFNFAFQGSGSRGFFMDPSALSPFVNNHALLTEIYKSHWTEGNMVDRPFWPRLSTQSITVNNPQENWYDVNNVEERKSTYFMRECSFLRCTALELAYNLPESIRKKLRMQTVKFFGRVNNPFIISNFKLWDVELGETGFNYPIQKTYAVGLTVSF